MKWIKKILYGLLILLSLLSLFIILCAFWPALADKTAGLLYSNDILEDILEPDKEENTAVSASPVKLPADGNTFTSDEILHNIEEIGSLELPERPKGFTSRETNGASGISVPEEVAGRTGYTPIEESNEQIEDEEAERLKAQTAYGETGDDLTFAAEYYPYYGMLDDRLQRLYRQIYANGMAVNGIFTPIEQVSPPELRNVFMAVFNDHPEMFWLDSAYRGRFGRDGQCVEIVLQFNRTVDFLDDSKAEFHEAAGEILSGAENQGSDYEKEVYVHNALLDRITYNLQAPLNQTAYSALVNGQTVCAGYARAFQYLMRELGIPAYYCTGYAGQNHAWNIIRLDGEYYNVDATWDDTDPNTYDYFNKTDSDFSENHIRQDLSVYLPACNGIKYGNLESNPEEAAPDNRRSLEEAGLSGEQILTSLSDYYNDCYQKLLASGGSAEFQNVVSSEDLWLQCYSAYSSDAYSAGYMDAIFTQLGASSCEVNISAEELKGGEYLLTHNIILNE